MQTVISPFEYSPDEYNIVVRPSEESLDKIAKLQNQLKSLLGDTIWLMKPNALHITVMEIICHADYKDQNRKELFEEWYKQYNAITKDFLASCEPITLHFSELVVSPGAIIIKTKQSDELNDIRAKLLSHIELPAGTKIPPDITHCSIARYSQSINLEQAQHMTKNLGIDFSEQVIQFKLMNDLVPPEFSPKLIETYDLKI